MAVEAVDGDDAEEFVCSFISCDASTAGLATNSILDDGVIAGVELCDAVVFLLGRLFSRKRSSNEGGVGGYHGPTEDSTGPNDPNPPRSVFVGKAAMERNMRGRFSGDGAGIKT